MAFQGRHQAFSTALEGHPTLYFHLPLALVPSTGIKIPVESRSDGMCAMPNTCRRSATQALWCWFHRTKVRCYLVPSLRDYQYCGTSKRASEAQFNTRFSSLMRRVTKTVQLQNLRNGLGCCR